MPYKRISERTGKVSHLFTIQLPAMLWPKIERQSKSVGQKTNYYLSQLLQEALLKKDKR